MTPRGLECFKDRSKNAVTNEHDQEISCLPKKMLDAPLGNDLIPVATEYLIIIFHGECSRVSKVGAT